MKILQKLQEFIPYGIKWNVRKEVRVSYSFLSIERWIDRG